MANYKLADVDQLDADLTTVANAIRSKRGTSAKLDFPAGYKKAIEAISTGTQVQKASGSFSTDGSGKATVNCGFQPDVVQVTVGSDEEGTLVAAADFASANNSKVNSAANYESYTSALWDFTFTRTSTGFSVNVYSYTWDWEESKLSNKTLNYTAIKYT